MPRRAGRSDEEMAMRDLIVPRLRHTYPSARIVHELPLRYSSNRIDLAAVTESQIIAVEIKSSRDVIDRLEAQVRAFLPVTSKIIVALAPKWNPQLPTLEVPGKGHVSYVAQYSETQALLRRIGGHVETWTVCAESAAVEVTEGGWRTSEAPWATQMLDMLWRNELEAIAHRHRICIPKRASHIVIRNACEEMMTGREVRAAVCSALRGRAAFDKASDAVPAAMEVA